MDPISKRELDIILDSTHDGMIAVDRGGIITLFNRAAERLTGLGHDTVVGRPAVEAIPNTRLHLVLSSGEAELNQQQTIGNTVIITNRMPVRDETGAVIGAVAVFRDITEIHALTARVTDLWRSRSLLEAIIEATDDAISVADEAGNNIIVNSAYTRITGLPKEAVLHKPVTVDIAEGESMHIRVLQTGRPVRNVRMKVGPLKKEVVVNVAPILIDGKIRGSVGIIHDISAIIALTDELARAKRLIRHLEARYTWEDIIGTSPAIEQAKEQAHRAAGTPATVLLRGESGTGKELFAHAIHNASPRRQGQFVRVNCASLAENLLESELFGYEGGAFTGATRGGRTGLIEEADGGTIFLDEVGEVGLALQSKLLRVLQEKEIMRVGGTRPRPVDVRVIAATNADLEDKVARKTFREDLYYRLTVIPIMIPPLRDRREDIPPLSSHIMFKLNSEYGRQLGAIADEAMGKLLSHDWPGNVRELENVLSLAMINMRPQETLMELRHLPPLPGERAMKRPVPQSAVTPLGKVVSEAEQGAILRALQETGGNRTKAASLLGISMRNLFYKLSKYKIS